MSKERMYIIGDRGNGVLIVKTDPLRVVEISDEEIKKYSESSGGDGYAKVAAALWRLVSDFKLSTDPQSSEKNTESDGVASLVKSGVKLTDVDFAFAAKIGAGRVHPHMDIQMDVQMDSHMDSYRPIESAISKIFSKGEEGLQSAILSDDKPEQK